MADLAVAAGSTSVSLLIFIGDSRTSDGSGLPGLVFNSAGLTCYYDQPGQSAVAVTLATLAAANSAWASGGFKEVDATNMPGVYRFDPPNAALTGGRAVKFLFKGAANMVVTVLDIDLINDATANATAVNAIKAKTDQLTFTVTNILDVNVKYRLDVAEDARLLGQCQNGGAGDRCILQNGEARVQQGDVLEIYAGTGIYGEITVDTVTGSGGSAPVAIAVKNQTWQFGTPDSTSKYRIKKQGGLAPYATDPSPNGTGRPTVCVMEVKTTTLQPGSASNERYGG